MWESWPRYSSERGCSANPRRADTGRRRLRYAADLHVHSPHSRATSSQLTLPNLAQWARLKGIDLLATGDFTHPAWLAELRDNLVESAEGLYAYDGVSFVLGSEVACVAAQGGRNRRVHVLIFAPGLDTAERVNTALAPHGALDSDGRPTLRLTPRDLLHLLLDVDERCLLLPAHVWTPWFGVYGSKSGFDSLAECFGDDAPRILAVETGLSADPAMCWRMAELDDVAIVSFSDAHSLPNLARELTVFDGELSYGGLVESMRTQSIAYTVEFFPEEGKYYHSGHRKCGVRLTPSEAERHRERCPSCGRKLTLGVSQRLERLATRCSAALERKDGLVGGDGGRPPFRSLIALRTLIAENMGLGVNTKSVGAEYMRLVGEFGSELALLVHAPVDELVLAAGERLAQAVENVRLGRVGLEPGYDGVYGRVSALQAAHGGHSRVREGRRC